MGLGQSAPNSTWTVPYCQSGELHTKQRVTEKSALSPPEPSQLSTALQTKGSFADHLRTALAFPVASPCGDACDVGSDATRCGPSLGAGLILRLSTARGTRRGVPCRFRCAGMQGV